MSYFCWTMKMPWKWSALKYIFYRRNLYQLLFAAFLCIFIANLVNGILKFNRHSKATNFL